MLDGVRYGDFLEFLLGDDHELLFELVDRDIRLEAAVDRMADDLVVLEAGDPDE